MINGKNNRAALAAVLTGFLILVGLIALLLTSCVSQDHPLSLTPDKDYDVGYQDGIAAGKTMCSISPEVIQQYRDQGRADALKEKVNCLHDPTVAELTAFLKSDDTNNMGLAICGDFAAMLTRRAKQQGIWARTVVINYSNSSRSHALNMFRVVQPDRCITETYVEPQTDWIVKVAMGYDYMQNWRDHDHEPAGADIIGDIFIFE